MHIKKISNATGNAALDLALDTIKIGKKALIFANTKNSAEKTAEDIARKIKIGSNGLIELSNNILKALPQATKQCERLAGCIKNGVAFHHAGLVAKQRELIEENFSNGLIKVICTTTTMAAGIDVPAFRSIIKDLRRYGKNGLAYIPVLEFLQMSGRAGRPKFDKTGEAITIATSENEKKRIYERYILGEAEEIYSKLAVEPVLRTYLLSLISANFANTEKQITDFFGKTFWAFQFMDMNELTAKLDKMLLLLEKWKFIQKEGINLKATITGKRVAELYLDPLTAHFFINCLGNANSKKINEFSFLQTICHTLEIRPLLRVGQREHDRIQEELLKYYDFLLENEPTTYPEYEDFINSVKTALMLHKWIDEKDENFLLEEFNIRPGEIRSKLEVADWLLYCIEEISRIIRLNHLNKVVVKLRLRLRYGIKEELLPLVRIGGIGRVRARKLYLNRIRNLEDIKKAEQAKLSQILGRDTALSVKKQVGKEIKEVPKGKRKGQLSLERY